MRNLVLLLAVSSTLVPSVVQGGDRCTSLGLRHRRPSIHGLFRHASRVRCCRPPITACRSVTEVDAATSVTADDENMLPDQRRSKSPDGWISLFDGERLGEWRSTDFGGEGDVTIVDGQIMCGFGQYMTGITHSGEGIPLNNYEIELEAAREDGFDFFCGLTFPVDESHASFIVGGWGGSVVGISSIDGMDASENNTTAYMQFKNKQWYKIRVRVTPGRLQTWIDDQMIVDEEITSDRLSTRIEVERSKPLGIACFDTQAAFRNLRFRSVTQPAE